MKILTQTLLLTVCLCVTTIAAADAPDFDVLKSMSVADFRASGLDKLSDAQIKALDAWFATYQQQHAMTCGASATMATVSLQAPAGAAPATPDSFSAHIAGEFHGWSGGTNFTLDNGQVWEQIDDTVVTLRRMTNPKVTISKGAFNSYYMSVEGVNDTVQVKRLKP
jgi:hypothetical protein